MFSESDEVLFNLYSTQPSFESHLLTIAGLIEHYYMTRICLIAIEPLGTSYKMEILRTKLQELDICIAQEFTISGGRINQLIVETVQKLKLSNNIQVIVLLSPAQQGITFMKEAEKQNLTGKTWIGAGEWVTSPDLFKIKKEVIGGLLMVTIDSLKLNLLNQFIEKYTSGQYSNPYLDDLSVKLYGCKPSDDHCDLSLGYYESIGNHNSSCSAYQSNFNELAIYVADAVYIMAHALHKTLNCSTQSCNPISTYNHTLYKHYVELTAFTNLVGQQISFTYHEVLHPISIENLQYDQGCLHFVKITTWDPYTKELEEWNGEIRWRNGESTTIPTEVYETSCPVGNRKHDLDRQSCYYVCLKCGPGLVANGTTSQCFKCPTGYKANSNASDCQEIAPTKLDWRDPVNVGILTFILICFLLLIFVVAVYIRFSNTPIVKASNEVMSYLQLFSIALVFILASSYQFAVTTPLCWFQYALCCISLPLCNACLLAKTKHVADVFNTSSQIRRISRRSHRPWIKSLVQVLFVFSITAIAVIIWLIFAIIDPPRAAYDYRYEHVVHVRCATNLHLGIGLVIGYTLLLAVICTILAWKTRKLPDNFNEARYIFICSFCTLFIVSLAVPGYYSTVGLLQSSFASISTVAFGLATLMLLFSPKVYTMLFRPDLNTKQAVLRSIQQFTFSPDTRIMSRSNQVSCRTSISSMNSEIPLRHQQQNSNNLTANGISSHSNKHFTENKDVLPSNNHVDHKNSTSSGSAVVVNDVEDDRLTPISQS